MSFKNKNLCFEKADFIHGCMCEGVSEDSRHGAWHVEICRFLLNVCGCVNMALHVYLGGE